MLHLHSHDVTFHRGSYPDLRFHHLLSSSCRTLQFGALSLLNLPYFLTSFSYHHLLSRLSQTLSTLLFTHLTPFVSWNRTNARMMMTIQEMTQWNRGGHLLHLDRLLASTVHTTLHWLVHLWGRNLPCELSRYYLVRLSFRSSDRSSMSCILLPKLTYFYRPLVTI